MTVLSLLSQLMLHPVLMGSVASLAMNANARLSGSYLARVERSVLQINIVLHNLFPYSTWRC